MSGTDLPTFFIVGAMKAGTTSLAKYVGQHPDVFICEPKEPRFFMERGTWHRGVDWYRSLFADGRDHATRGEATTGYTKLPVHTDVPERISQLVPDARIVYLTREPLARIRSQYVHNVTHSKLRAPLAEALETDPSYVAFSRYAFQIEPYRRIFGADRVLVLANEQLRDDRTATVDRVFDFIGVSLSATDLDLSAVSNEGSRKREQLRDGRLVSGAPGLLRRSGLRKLTPAPLRRRVYRTITQPLIRADDLIIPPAVESEILSTLASEREELERVAPGTTDWWDDPHEA